MKHPQLAVKKREVFGKKLKNLRKQGILPGNIYGKEVKSQSVEVGLKDFEAVFKETGESGLVDLKLDSETRPVLIKNLQLEPVYRTPLHVDFYQVNLKEKVKTMVPVVSVGEPKAVLDKAGILLQQLSEVEVEALPEALPENIEVNVEKLSAVGDQITVGDLKMAEGVVVLTGAEQVVFKIDELISKEAQEQAAAEALAKEAAKAEAAAEAGEAPAEGEAPKAEGEAAPAEEQKPEASPASAEASAGKETKTEQKPQEEKKE